MAAATHVVIKQFQLYQGRKEREGSLCSFLLLSAAVERGTYFVNFYRAPKLYLSLLSLPRSLIRSFGFCFQFSAGRRSNVLLLPKRQFIYHNNLETCGNNKEACSVVLSNLIIMLHEVLGLLQIYIVPPQDVRASLPQMESA